MTKWVKWDRNIQSNIVACRDQRASERQPFLIFAMRQTNWEISSIRSRIEMGDTTSSMAHKTINEFQRNKERRTSNETAKEWNEMRKIFSHLPACFIHFSIWHRFFEFFRLDDVRSLMSTSTEKTKNFFDFHWFLTWTRHAHSFIRSIWNQKCKRVPIYIFLFERIFLFSLSIFWEAYRRSSYFFGSILTEVSSILQKLLLSKIQKWKKKSTLACYVFK